MRQLVYIVLLLIITLHFTCEEKKVSKYYGHDCRSRSRFAIRFPSTHIPRPKHTLESLPVDVDELEKRDMVKNRPIPENMRYQ